MTGCFYCVIKFTDNFLFDQIFLTYKNNQDSKRGERRVALPAGTDTDRSTLSSYAKKNIDLMDKPDHYVGLWNDPATGIVYLDISVNTMSAEEAQKDCKGHDQIAFFDLQDYNSVTVNPNATSGQG